MGTIETHIDPERDLTIHTASGEISANEILRRIRSYYEGEVTRLLMWDLSNADLRSPSASDVQNMVDLTNSLTTPRAGGKTALVVSTTLAYGMGRMYELSKDAFGDEIDRKMFRDREAALEWLEVPPPD